jgi:hypothetical protein
MLHALALASAAAAALALVPPVSAPIEPCRHQTGTPALEEFLPRVRAALDLAGTDQVGIDPSGQCIGVQVRTRGTARLVKLLLRGLEVPRHAVELRVVEVKPVRDT